MLGFYSFYSHGWKLKKLFDIVLLLYNSAQFVIVKWLNVDLTVHKFCNSKQMLKIIHICMNFFGTFLSSTMSVMLRLLIRSKAAYEDLRDSKLIGNIPSPSTLTK